MAKSFALTPRTELNRLKARGSYDRATVYSILDEGLVCHVGFVSEGSPHVIPTGYCRIENELYLHGSVRSRMLQVASSGAEVCVEVTVLDGLVLARSAFHHSINYRSVVIYGRPRAVEDPKEKLTALHRFVEHVVPGRWADARKPTESELKATAVIAIPLEEASAKIRTGPPIDDEADYALPIWAGTLPMRLESEAPVNDPELDPEMRPPYYLMGYVRRL